MELVENTIEFDFFEQEVHKQYPYISDDDIRRIVNKAKMFYFSTKFPNEPNASEETRPITSFVAENWILTVCEELIERLGFNSATGYRENGISWTFDNAQISQIMMSLNKPTIGVLKQ